jgi:hypothetical protein
MTNKEIENLMSKFEDFIELENENLTSSKYERGFNMGIGLCLSTLEDEKK